VSIFRVEVCRMRNWLYVDRMQRMWPHRPLEGEKMELSQIGIASKKMALLRATVDFS
jgi:hypothetical protein